MATDKQIAVNRLNARKCTGAKTPAGRAVSSQNALKTGLDAKSEVIRTESREGYEELTTEYYTRFHPTVPEERRLVDTLITSEWLGRRYLRVDTATWEQRFEETKSESVARVLTEPRLEEAAVEPTEPTDTPSTDITAEPLTPGLFSFLTPAPQSQAREDAPEKENIPPIAA